MARDSGMEIITIEAALPPRGNNVMETKRMAMMKSKPKPPNLLLTKSAWSNAKTISIFEGSVDLKFSRTGRYCSWTWEILLPSFNAAVTKMDRYPLSL
jgi:hypothetical protein